MGGPQSNARRRCERASGLGRKHAANQLRPWAIVAAVLASSAIGSNSANAGGTEGGPSAFGGGFISQTNTAGTTPAYMTPEEAARFEQDMVTFMKGLNLAVNIGFVGTGAVLGAVSMGPMGAVLAVAANPFTPKVIEDIAKLSVPKSWISP